MGPDLAASYDVVFVGGGIVGSAGAFFLASDPGFSGKIAVVERDPSYARASTTLSNGCLRQQFSLPENVRMALFGAKFYQEAARHLAVGGAPPPELGFRAAGYLFLATPATETAMRANHEVQREAGAVNQLLNPAQLAEKFPWLNLDGVALGSFGLQHEGCLDPYSAVQAFRAKARALGVVYLQDEVVGIVHNGDRVSGVQLACGGAVGCGTLVNAAGPAAANIAAMAGVALPVRPRKRMLYVFDCRTQGVCQGVMLIDPSGVFVRAEGQTFVCGVSPPEESDPDATDFEVDYQPFETVVWPALAHRVPAFESIKLSRGWAGHYEVNTLDHNAILGRHPKLRNFVLANGFSGHGLMQAPATGRAIAEIVLHGRSVSLDLDRFSYDRVAAGRPLPEQGVI
jgi:FAD-dependent oxidoreductase domain-containing protein 1